MPQKDTALTLAQAARSFIASCNAVLASGRQAGSVKGGSSGSRAGDMTAGGAGSRAGDMMAGGAGSRAVSAFLIPRFPLFAFADALPDGGFRACRILAPEREGRVFFFPVELEARSTEKAGFPGMAPVFPAAGGGLSEALAAGESPVTPAAGGMHVLRLRIVFAELEGGAAGRSGGVTGQPACNGSDGSAAERQPFLPELPQEYLCRECFPLRPRVFRTGRVEYSGCSWEVWDERWQKLLP